MEHGTVSFDNEEKIQVDQMRRKQKQLKHQAKEYE